MKTARQFFKSATLTSSAFFSGLLLAVCLCLTACHTKAIEDANTDPVGTYSLVSVNAKPLPAAVSHGETPMEVRSGTFVINADGTCSSKVSFALASGPEVTRTVEATYTRSGPTLSMQWKGAGKTTGTIAGNGFTMDNEGMVFAYEKSDETGDPAL